MKQPTLTIAFMAIIGICYNQINDTNNIKSVVIINNYNKLSPEDSTNVSEAGWSLKQYATFNYIASAAMFGGTAITGIGAIIYSGGNPPTVMWIGVGISIAGFIFDRFNAGFINSAGNRLIRIGKK